MMAQAGLRLGVVWRETSDRDSPHKMGDGVLYTEDGATSAGEALTRSSLLDAELTGTTLEYTVGGADYRQEPRPLAKGGYNTVRSAAPGPGRRSVEEGTGRPQPKQVHSTESPREVSLRRRASVPSRPQ